MVRVGLAVLQITGQLQGLANSRNGFKDKKPGVIPPPRSPPWLTWPHGCPPPLPHIAALTDTLCKSWGCACHMFKTEGPAHYKWALGDSDSVLAALSFSLELVLSWQEISKMLPLLF